MVQVTPNSLMKELTAPERSFKAEALGHAVFVNLETKYNDMGHQSVKYA